MPPLVFILGVIVGRRSRSAWNESKATFGPHVTDLDAMTGLFDRNWLQRHLAEACDVRGVLLLDLDGFKSINDLHGHLTGDELLVEVSKRLRKAVTDGLVARIGGDEFAVVIPLSSEKALAASADALRERLGFMRLPSFQAGVGVSASVGYGVHRPGVDPKVALRDADLRLQVAKSEREHTWYGDLAVLVADVLERAPESELLDAVAGALAQFAAADAVVLVVGELEASAPDFAASELVRSARKGALAHGSEVVALAAAGEAERVASALLGERSAPLGSFACVRREQPFTKRERVAIAHAGRLLAPSLQARNRLNQETGRANRFELLSYTDETTGVPNRRALLRWLETTDPGVTLSALLIDFDGLRAVNNELGPGKGDELIQAVAEAIGSSLREGEFAARLHGSGGDEFVVCCPNVERGQAALRALELERLLMQARLPADLARLYGGASVGFSVRASNEPAEEFLGRAAAAMSDRKTIRKADAS